MGAKARAAKAGYDQEEVYFWKREQELIQRLRQKLKISKKGAPTS